MHSQSAIVLPVQGAPILLQPSPKPRHSDPEGAGRVKVDRILAFFRLCFAVVSAVVSAVFVLSKSCHKHFHVASNVCHSDCMRRIPVFAFIVCQFLYTIQSLTRKLSGCPHPSQSHREGWECITSDSQPLHFRCFRLAQGIGRYEKMLAFRLYEVIEAQGSSSRHSDSHD